MTKKILVIMGHPSNNSFNRVLADSYIDGAKKSGNEVKKIYIGDLKFDPILHEGYRTIQELEPDLVKSQKSIKWAEHIVFFYPVWWGSMPALLKGFIDRVFLPGFAFKYKEGKLEKYLNGKTASLILTAGGSSWIYKLAGRIMNKPMTVAVLNFCGIKSKKQMFIPEMRKLDEEKAKKIVEEMRILGEKGI